MNNKIIGLSEFLNEYKIEIDCKDSLNLIIDNKYFDFTNEASDVFIIQKLLFKLSFIKNIEINWQVEKNNEVLNSPNSFPIVACLLMHKKVKHNFPKKINFEIQQIREKIHSNRIKFDWFTQPKMIICADHYGLGHPPDLYDSINSINIKSREHFEQIIFPYVERHLANNQDLKSAFKWRASLAAVVYEIFENTDLHGKTGFNNEALNTSIRGIIFREIEYKPYQSVKNNLKHKKSLEISIFDSGLGYFEKSQNKKIDVNLSINDELKILENCLSMHLEDNHKFSAAQGLHGIGLYEVLRALKFLQGSFEIRTGRLHAYRSFMPDDLALQMEKNDSISKPNMPKAKLLDMQNIYLIKPTEHPKTIGASIKITVPI